jgi:hypothetical protein
LDIRVKLRLELNKERRTPIRPVREVPMSEGKAHSIDFPRTGRIGVRPSQCLSFGSLLLDLTRMPNGVPQTLDPIPIPTRHLGTTPLGFHWQHAFWRRA